MRKIFDNIISIKNLEPKPNTEYIYNLDMVFMMDSLGSKPVKKRIIVENVEQMYSGDYSFNIKGQTDKYRCTYGWAFVENTKENIELLKQIDFETEILEKQKLKIDKLNNSLVSLYQNNDLPNKIEN